VLQVLDLDADGSASNNNKIPLYWQQVHLMLTFRILVARTSSELAAAVMNSHKGDAREEPPYAKVTPAALSERLQLFQDLLAQLQDALVETERENAQKEDDNININSNSNKSNTTKEAAQILAQVAAAYQLSKVEKRVLQFLVTAKIQPSTCALFLVLPSTADYYTCLPGSGHGGDENMSFLSSTIRYVTAITAMEWKALANDDHPLCKDRVLIWEQEEYSDTSKLSVSSEACKAFLNLTTMTSEDKLKLAGTKLLELTNHGGGGEDDDEEALAALASANKHAPPKSDNSDDTVGDILSKLQNSSARRLVDDNDKDDNNDDDFDLLTELTKEQDLDADETIEPSQGEPSAEQEEEANTNINDDDEEEDRTKPRAFNNELDYLHQYFDIVMHKIALSRQRVAQDLRNASLNDTKPSWMRNAADNSAKQRSVGEISAKLRLESRKMDMSLALTRQQGNFYPRLELLAEQLAMDDFQKFVLVYLTGSMLSPVFKSCIQGEDSYGSDKNPKVGDLLVAYWDTFAEQVAARTYFYKSSTLLRKGIIKPINDYTPPPDLTDQQLRLDRRVLETIVGLDKESSEISQGSHLYEPKVSLDAVVLPDKLKETIMGSVAHFETFRAYRKHHPDFDEAISYGVGLTLMFCGKSGTGKTMTANAIAAKLGKKLLLVNFPLLNKQNGKDEGHETKFQSIFREAELSDAIIFFDECESLFSKRSRGGSIDTTELLTELERFEGIVFLATNRPFDLDEAMYRRINEVFQFKAPNYLERLDIWKLVTSHKAVPCDPSIDWESIALKYELTGGFIKNAVISALLDGVGRDPKSPRITEVDILNGCKKQVRGALQMVDFNERVIPKEGLSSLVVSKPVMDNLSEMVSLEKARGILFGSWGFDEDMRSRQGTTALFWGPSGTGRSRSAEAVGFELGKPLKVVDLPRLLSGRQGGHVSNDDTGAQAARTVFQEARLQDAVLVLDGFSLETEQGGGGGGSDDARLLNIVVREMARFPGVVIMMVDTTGSLDVFVSRIDKSLLKNLKFLVEFQLPSSSNRKILWEKLMPPALPVLKDIDYKKLAEGSNSFNVSHIGNAIYRAAAGAALRTNAKDRFVGMKDLNAAIEEEKTRGESAVDRWAKSQYI